MRDSGSIFFDGFTNVPIPSLIGANHCKCYGVTFQTDAGIVTSYLVILQVLNFMWFRILKLYSGVLTVAMPYIELQ